MSDRYRTIGTGGESLLREKGSRFIGIAFHAAAESDAREGIARIAKQHHASRHICFAYVLGPGMELQRVNDAGEPAGTAGAPILRAIQQAGLTCIAVVVVRYFGGTLLGKGGLIRAYGEAARDAIAGSTVKEEVIRAAVSFRCPLARVDWLKQELRRMDGMLTESSFGDDCNGVAMLPGGAAHEAIARWGAHGIIASLSGEEGS